jgi:ATP-dependent Clp protease ATP-binding subunit ClpC
MERLKAKKIQLELDEPAKEFLVEKGYDPTYGARPMRRAVERYLEDPLAEEILRGKFHDKAPIHVTVEQGKLTFNQPAATEGAALPG